MGIKRREEIVVFFFFFSMLDGCVPTVFAYKTRWFLSCCLNAPAACNFGVVALRLCIVCFYLLWHKTLIQKTLKAYNHRQSARSKKIPKTIVQSIILVTQKTEWFNDNFPNYAPQPPSNHGCIHSIFYSSLFFFSLFLSYTIRLYNCLESDQIKLLCRRSTELCWCESKMKIFTMKFFCAYISHARPKNIFFSPNQHRTRVHSSEIRCRAKTVSARGKIENEKY